MSLLRVKNGEVGGGEGSSSMPTMRPVSMGRPLVTMSTYQERGETLKRTSIMPDESCYRNSINSNGFSTNSNRSNSNSNSSNTSNSSSNTSNNNRLQPQNGINPANGNGSPELPPPPPQFANPQPKQMPPQQLKLIAGNGVANGNGNGSGLASRSGSGSGLGNGSLAKVKQPMSPMRSASISVGGFRPPATPQPDYDAVQLRSPPGSASGSGSGLATSQQQRRTLRLGTVTIGEYGDQRTTGKRETLRKINGEAGSNGILKNGTNRSSASFNHGSTHQPEKSIKFGN